MLDSSPEDEDFPGRLLHQAALWDNTELLEDLLEGGQQYFINSQDSWGRTPLHAAAITENSSCLQVLLNAGADCNIQCGPRGENKTPLHLSAEHGHCSNISALLQQNANMLVRDSSGMTASDLADKAGHVQCINLLKEAADAREKARLDVHAALRDACTRNDTNTVQQLITSLFKDTVLIINMAPSGANTLLFIASQIGNKTIVKILLDHGADGRYHPVTKYSPLYIACYHGHKDIVEMLLLRFPELIQQHTVERWLPIHASAINGHLAVLELLFHFPYPSRILQKFRDSTDQWEYFMAFDINERDATGQNILYVACLLGNKRLLDMILKFKVKATRIKVDEEVTPSSEGKTLISPTSRRVSDGIQSILTKLNLSRDNSFDRSTEIDADSSLFCPLKINMYCNNNTETALHAAVKGKHYDIAMILLSVGANPNLIIRSYQDVKDDLMDTFYGNARCCSEELNYSQSSALVEACRNRDVPLVDLLLRHGARDDDCKALAIVVQNKDETLSAKLLSVKANPDPEYKINKKPMTESINSSQFSIFSTISNLTYSTLFPNTPTMINWHNQRCHLSQIRTQWLTDAALHLNPKLKQNPRSYDIALYAITRLDISSNSLTSLPLGVFQLCSLKYLNVAQNKIEKLPVPLESPVKKGRKKKSVDELGYNCPVLEELYLQDNRLDFIPDALFKLPSLVTLVVSNNKLQSLHYDMWQSPKLKELNCAFNLLKELPSSLNDSCREADRLSISSSDSQLSSHIDNEGDHELHSDLESDSEETDGVRYKKKEKSFRQLDLTKHHIWNKSVEVTEQILHNEESVTEKSSQLSSLNLAHNLFSSIPVVLPCLAVNLTKLNMSFNSLRSMSHITSYPSSLKQLDLSHNQISCWPSLPQVEAQDTMELANLACYSKNLCGKDKLPLMPVQRQSARSIRNAVLHSVCSHRRHLRLDNLRTLVLADNRLTRIQLATDDDGDLILEDEESEHNVLLGKARLMFPNISMLDVSNNDLKEIPINIYELNNLSIFNISGNVDINELPPPMGLLSRLWNLNTRGCPLQEPLKSMIESKKYKTMDIIGYLKSVLEDAKLYARMKLMIVGVQGIGKTSLLDLLRQEGTTKRKPVEHWAKRMGNKNINVKTFRGTNMSTVGVDIGDWVYEKKIRNQSVHGPVVFRTWDFGGQKEYYATHQYFLSKRSLYLVVWRIIDGQKGINEISQWLVNIQARAPNSPVLIIGTHYDVVQETNSSVSEEYQQIIRDKFINIVDAEKCGLPRVLDTIEVSCKTRHNLKLLCNLIYDTVFNLRPPGSKELLLEQKVPATYLILEDVVNHVAFDRRVNGLDPVLTAEQYRTIVSSEMQSRYNRSFRDSAELHQATLFLHDNGVLLHYDDATLRDLYFLDPQWLCDMLAHVVTIREINPFARTGIMKLDDLKHIFKSSNIGSIDTKDYIVNLLNKFEVALTWDSRTLLIPSLLPSEEDINLAQIYPEQYHMLVKVKVPLRSRGWAIRNKKITVSPKSMLYGDCSGEKGKFTMTMPNTSRAIEEPLKEVVNYSVTSRSSERAITRLLLMSYFPSGFWSRLISRILADDTIIDIIRSFFILPKELAQDAEIAKLLDLKAEWVLWKTGFQLKYGDITLFRMREILPSSGAIYKQLRFKLKQDGVWCDVDLQNTSILEIHFPAESLVIKPTVAEMTDYKYKLIDELIIDCKIESTSQLLALAVDHVDILLEDWYPTLGTRFVHTSEGKFLVTRLVPCPKCLLTANELDQHEGDYQNKNIFEEFGNMENEATYHNPHRVRKSQESYTSECDSGVGRDSTDSSRMPSVEGHPNVHSDDQTSSPNQTFYSWMVEECILAAYGDKFVVCPTHADVELSLIAPDVIFLDLGDRHLIRSENIKKGHLLGRGAFGFVFKGTCKNRGSNAVVDIAMKMLQPVHPGPNARKSASIAYKAAQGKWDRDPIQYACKAYCTARQELNILLSLRHPNIVPFVGLCSSPLALVLDLAPQGALDLVLRHYRRSGAKIGPYTLQAVILQVAKAIEYLHRQHVIYRDLKSENVLVWEMPPPFTDHPDHAVHIKVADYGISRLTLPSGTKGFGGTEGFMAPEIMRYNGEEEYTEKVDCFSFGMFIYELLTLHQPFEGHESVKECILEGGRPPLSYRETLYPSYCLDLMVLCWSQLPKDRPSASQIVSIASAPEFVHLSDVISLKHAAQVTTSTTAPVTHITDDGLSGSEMWLMCANSRVDLLLASNRGWLQYHSMVLPIRPTAVCSVNNNVWIGDCVGQIHAYLASDGRRIFSYALESSNASVNSLLYLPALKRVACGLSNGRLFLLNTETVPVTPTSAEGSFVMTELGSTLNLHSLCVLFKDNGSVCELWCGQSHGQISIYSIKDHVVTNHEVINHFDPVLANINVLNLISCEKFVYSYVSPGCVIYQWKQKSRSIVNKLDCSKLVPCSESLKSIAIEEHLSPTNCQVTSLAVLHDELYIGTSWGCVIIVERLSLRPITIFRPYEEEVKSIVPLVMCGNENNSFLATIGRGYRSLLTRYTDVPTNISNALQSPVATGMLSNTSKQNMFVLLWRAEHWGIS